MAVTAQEQKTTRDRARTHGCCVDVHAAMMEVTRAPIDQQHRLLEALAEPTRLQMVHLLSRTGELCVCDFTQAFDLGQPTISHHLRVLREAGVVNCRKAGQWVYCSINRGTIKDLVGILLDLA